MESLVKHHLPPTKTRVIHTRGTDYEIGAQHGEALGSAVSEGMVRFFAQLWSHLTEPNGKGPVGKFAVAAFRDLIAPRLKRRLVRQIPTFARERLDGMAKMAGMPAEALYELVILPDFGPVLQAIQSRLFPDRFVEFQAPTFGCSSYFTGKEGGSFYFGRNLDFPGTGYWDRFPVIQMFQRQEGLKYIGFTSAGIPMAGISGINEAGIAVALHQHYSNRFRWDGELPFFISEKILQRATNLEEAISIVSESRVASAWAFLIADGKRRNAAIIEALPDRQSVRRWSVGENPLAHSNYLVSETCRECETSASARMSWDNFYRRNRLMERLDAFSDNFSPALGVKLLGDGLDPYWNEEKILNRVVSQNYNIKSMLLDLTEMKVWMAESNAPPVHLGHYREFDLQQIFDGKSGDTGRGLPGFRFQNAHLEEAKIALIQGYMASTDGDSETALKKLKKVLEIHFIPEAAHIHGVLLLQQGDGRGAADLFRKAQEWIERKMTEQKKTQPPPEYFESMLFEARATDVLGDRKKALAIYRRLAEHPHLEDANLRKVAARAKRYTVSRARRIIMPFSTYVPFQ